MSIKLCVKNPCVPNIDFDLATLSFSPKDFCTFVRPVLEYSSVIWIYVYKYDIDEIEAAQRRVLKWISVCRTIVD